MRKLIYLCVLAALMSVCNSDNEKKKQDKDLFQNKTKVESAKIDTNDLRKKSYTWTKTDRDKFLNDCFSESEDEDIGPQKLKEFCNCLLNEAQKYYPAYRHIDEDSDEDHDRDIFEHCIGHYPADEE